LRPLGTAALFLYNLMPIFSLTGFYTQWEYTNV